MDVDAAYYYRRSVGLSVCRSATIVGKGQPIVKYMESLP